MDCSQRFDRVEMDRANMGFVEESCVRHFITPALPHMHLCAPSYNVYNHIYIIYTSYIHHIHKYTS
jgi:hypothetical protein